MKTHLLLLALFSPAFIVGIVGLRASFLRHNDAWADYSDIATLLDWFATPMIVVLIPVLAAQKGFTAWNSAMLGALAILLFCVSRSSMSPETGRSFLMRMQGIAAGSGPGLGVVGLIIYTAAFGNLSRLVPSSSLYISLLWSPFLGCLVMGFLLQGMQKDKILGSGELLDRITQIAARRKAKLEKVEILKSAPGCSKCVNAVAFQGTQVLIFQDLIAGLTKAEVDAVIEHEIGHIADDRLWTLDQALRYGGNLLLLAIIYLVEERFRGLKPPISYSLYAIWAAIFVVPEFLLMWYSRAAERRASRNVGVLIDPLAAVSAHYKVVIMNHGTLSRPWWSRIISTHPCADEELASIAARHNLKDEQIEQVCRKADQEMQSAVVAPYDLTVCNTDSQPDSDAAANKAPRAKPVQRPGFWAGCGVAFLSLLGCIVVMAASVAALLNPSVSSPIFVIIFFVGGGCALAIPIEVAKNRRLKKLMLEIKERLVENYGAEKVAVSLFIDAMFPADSYEDGIWQGALLEVSEGKLNLLGEVDQVSISLQSKINLSLFCDINSSGRDARMVALKYQVGEAVHSIFLRIIGKPEPDEPDNWKQLEKHIKGLLDQSGGKTVSRNELTQTPSRKFRWSSRVPIAAGIYLTIIALADFLARSLNGNDFDLGWWFMATLFSGPQLWGWITSEKRDD